MESFSKTFNCICRLCLKLHDNISQMSPLVHCDNKLSSYGESLKNITNVRVQIQDKLPNNMCENCKDELNKMVSFKSMCELNNRNLLLLVNNDYKNATQDEKMELICTYAMYRQSFPETCTVRPENNVKDTIEPESFDISEEKNQEFPSLFENDTISENSFKNDEESFESCNESVDLLLNTMEKIYAPKFTAKSKRSLRKNFKMKFRQNETKEVKTYICPICNKKLANSVTFQGHMNTHEQNRFICDQCGKALSTKSALYVHLVARHQLPSSFECDYCGFRASRKHELIEHIRLHTGERPFACEKCGLTFRRQAIWKVHLKCHTEKSIQCTMCPRKFFRLGDLKAHVNSLHDRMYLYLCKVCNQSYAKIISVRKHMAAKHGVPREAQGKVTRVTKSTHRSLFQDKPSLDED